GDALQLAPGAIPEVDQGSHSDDGGEHGCQDADDVNDCETAYRTGSKSQQSQTHNERGQVGVENGAPCSLEAQGDGLLGRVSGAQFFTNTFIDEHVGVNSHAQCERNGCNARQGERGLQHGKGCKQKQHVEQQSQRGEHAEEPVVKQHEDGDRNEAIQGGIKALREVVGTQAGADGAPFGDFHGCSQRAGAQQQGNVGGFLSIHTAGNLNLPARNLATDDRRRYDLALALFEQHDGHATPDVVAGDVAENACALGVECQIDRGKLGLLVTPRLGILQVFTRENDLAAQEQGSAVSIFEAFEAKRHGACSQRGGGGRRIFHHTDFQRSGTTENFLSLGDVLHARQLDNDAVRALLLNHGLGHAQFVDPVVQRGDVLPEGVGLNGIDGLFGQLAAQRVVAAGLSGGREGEIRQGAAQFGH